MNVKVSIEMEGPDDEVSTWLTAHFGVVGTSGITGSSREAATGAVWTSEVADRLVARISRDARRALRYLAANAPTVSFSKLQRHMGMNGITIGGVMASFGFAENAGLPRPYVVNRRRREYQVDPAVASILTAALERHQAQSGSNAA